MSLTLFVRFTYRTRCTFLRLRLQQAVDEVLRILADLLPISLVEDNTAVLTLLDQVCQALTTEGGVSAEQSVGNDAHGPHVNRLAVSTLQHDLGGGITEGTSHGRELLVGRVEHLRNTEICEYERRIFGGGDVKKVLGLEICMVVRTRVFNTVLRTRTPVDNIVLVEIVDGVEDLADGLSGILLGEPALLANTVEQLSSGSELGDNVVFVLENVSGNCVRKRSSNILSTRTSRGSGQCAGASGAEASPAHRRPSAHCP